MLAGLVDAGFAFGAPSAECAEDDPTACALPMERGDKAPFAGQLLTPSLAIKLGQEAESCPARIELEVSRTSSIAKADLAYARRLHAIDLRSLDRQLIAVTQDRDHWRRQAANEASNTFWFVLLGAGAGIAAVYISTLIMETRP